MSFLRGTGVRQSVTISGTVLVLDSNQLLSLLCLCGESLSVLFFRVNCVVSSEVCIEGTGGVFCVRGDHGSSSRSMVLFRATCRKLPATNR